MMPTASLNGLSANDLRLIQHNPELGDYAAAWISCYLKEERGAHKKWNQTNPLFNLSLLLP